MKMCINCGVQFPGNFCSNCGAAARPGQQGISNTFLKGGDLEEALGFFSALTHIASSPITNTLGIASSTECNQKAFLVKCIAISAAIGVLSKVQTTNDIVASIVGTGGMFVVVFIQVVLTYYGFRMLSSTYRSGGDYARLICIAQGIAFLFMGTGELLGLTFGPEVYALAMLIQAVILIPYWAIVLGRFWNMNSILAYIIYLVSMLPAAGLIFLLFPILEQFIYF